MSLVTHKYTPAEMPDHELEATFAAREHTVDYLLKSLRDQIHSGTLSSYVITGPRGAGKSTVIQMVDLRIRQDAELSAAWIPVVFPEEQFNMISLRDMLAATLQALAKNGVLAASAWLDKVEAEPNEEQSQQLAITGLREITRQTGKRLVLFIENLNQLLEDNFDSQMKGTLRRLLMSEAFMMIIGSTVHIFESLKNYDEAFFNYFGQVTLDRLNAEQVSELLRKRAAYDQNERFLRELPQQQAKVRTLVHLTGGNPRFVLMLYELLSQHQVTSIVQYLRKLVDELTPLLKDEMENLPAQQRKIIHALMERGGTAQPTDLTGPTRLPLNAINTQLKRLKDAQIVEVLGGGKGRAANYTVPDKLFSIWYQMRYLSQNRRRIELFVEVLRIWYAEEERIETLKQLVKKSSKDAPHALRDCAATAEYFAASLKGTIHQKLATDLCIDSWSKADLNEAAFAYADLSQADISREADDATPHTALAAWLNTHGDPKRAVEAMNRVLAGKEPYTIKQAKALLLRGFGKSMLGEDVQAISDFQIVLNLKDLSDESISLASLCLGNSKRTLGDIQGAIDDLTRAIKLESRSEVIVEALINRGSIKVSTGDLSGALADFDSAISKESKSTSQLARAYCNRALVKWRLEDKAGAFDDAQQVIGMEAVPNEQLSRAYVFRAGFFAGQNQISEAVADFLRILDLDVKEVDVVTSAGLFAFCLRLAQNENDKASEVLDHFVGAVNKFPENEGREIIIRFLIDFAENADASEWADAWQKLVSRLRSEIAEAIRFLGPVCEVLTGDDRTLLDALPPEQREFALKVLSKFESKPKAEPIKVSKAKTRKRASKK